MDSSPEVRNGAKRKSPDAADAVVLDSKRRRDSSDSAFSDDESFADAFDAEHGFEILPSDSSHTAITNRGLDFFHSCLSYDNQEVHVDGDDLQSLHKRLRTHEKYSFNLSMANVSNPKLYRRVSDLFFSEYDGRTPAMRSGVKLYKVSAIECASAKAAVKYFKSFNGTDTLRRFKHLSFSTRAMYGQLPQHDIYWNRLANYLTNQVSIETIDVFVPLDVALSTIHNKQDVVRCLEKFSEVFDWEILELLSHCLIEGSIKRLRICYPLQSLKTTTTIDKLKAIRRLKSYAASRLNEMSPSNRNNVGGTKSKGTGTAFDPISFDCDKPKGTAFDTISVVGAGTASDIFIEASTSNIAKQLRFFGISEVQHIHGDEGLIITIERRVRSLHKHPQLSLLGLPREVRDLIVDYGLRDDPKTFLSTLLTSTQLYEEASWIFYKSLVFNCSAKEALYYIASLPARCLSQVRSVTFDPGITDSMVRENTEYWHQLANAPVERFQLKKLLFTSPKSPT